MKTFYSKDTGGFYVDEIHGSRLMAVVDPAWKWPLNEAGEPDYGVAADMIEVDNPDCKIPVDAVEVTGQEHAALLAGQSSGRMISADAQGRPSLQDRPPMSFALAKAAEFTTFRADREQFLNRLAGIGLAAQVSGQADVVAGAMQLRQGLLELTTYPAVVAATDIAALRLAMKTRYAALLGAVPVAVRAAFKGVDA